VPNVPVVVAAGSLEDLAAKLAASAPLNMVVPCP
jgi:hypothetical protein